MNRNVWMVRAGEGEQRVNEIAQATFFNRGEAMAVTGQSSGKEKAFPK